MTVEKIRVPISVTPSGLFIFDAERRTYLALNRAGDAYHLIRPADAEDPLVRDGRVEVGDLICTCPGGRYGRGCYRLEEARAWESEQQRECDVDWFDAAPGELQEAWGK